MKSCGIVLGLLALVAIAGCNSGRAAVKKVDVSGKLTVGGEPVEGVTVYFVGENHTGTGVTRPDGSFDLMTGAQPGNNLIYFQAAITDGMNEEEGIDAYQMQMMAEAGGPGAKATGAASKLPKELTDPATSTLKYEVPADGTDSANFKL
jgi:hypothetical protein